METSLLGAQYRLTISPDTKAYAKDVWLTEFGDDGMISMAFEPETGVWPEFYLGVDDFFTSYELVALPKLVSIEVFKIGSKLFAREGHSDRLIWIKEK